MPMRVSANRIDMDDKVLQKPELKDYAETVVTANSSTSYTVDLTNGNVFNITLTGNCAFTFSNPPASGKAGSFTLFLTQDGTGGRTVTWPGAVRWPAGTEPTLYDSSGSVNIFTFLTINGGLVWLGAYALGENNYNPYLLYGYFAGGKNGAPIYTTIDRIDYSSDTSTASAKGSLVAARYEAAGVGNKSYGYYGAGSDGTEVATIYRLDYSNDTSNTVSKGGVTNWRQRLAGVGNSSYGYLAAGDNDGYTTSEVDRIDYSNDTATAAGKGPLSSANNDCTGVGTSTYGYICGGAGRSWVDRIDYSNDTATASAKGPLSLARGLHGAAGNSSYGYLGGGQSFPNVYSTVDRIDFSNDTSTASAKGPLSLARRGLSGSTNSSYGYMGGGIQTPTYSTVDRIDYSSDTSTASAKGPLSLARYGVAGTNSNPISA